MSGRNRVFFGKLSHDARKRDIERWLEDYGFKHIENIQLKIGFAFVDFRDSRDAEDCVKDLDRRDFMGEKVTVELARGPRTRDRREDHRDDSRGRVTRRPYTTGRGYSNGYYRDRYGAPYNTEWRLMVENLSSRAGWQEMKDFFRQAGNVTFSECHRHKTGEGAVEFSSREDMKRAVEKLDGEDFMGRRIRLIDVSSNTTKRDTNHKVSSPRSPARDRGRRRTRSYSHHSRTRSRSH